MLNTKEAHESATYDSARAEKALGLSKDDAVLAALGYKQEFKREFTKLETFGLSFSILGLVPSMASVLVFAIPNGGPVAMLWGWAVACSFLLFISLAMAELGSAAPTSGGLYYWTHRFASPKCRNLLSWIVGYSNTIGIIAGVTSIDWGCAVQIMAAVSIGSDQTFSATIPQTFGVFTALLCSHVIVSSMATKVLARLQSFYIFANVVLILALVIGLPAATPKEFRNTAKFALTDFQNFNGWPSGYAFILSFLAPLWTIGGFDSSVHISEEATNANVAVPFTIVTAPNLASFLGFIVNLVLVFFMGTDLASIVDNPIGQPMATIIFNSFGKHGTLAIWSLIVIVQFMMGTSYLLASSRQSFAFARDGALPLSSLIYRINPYTKTPVNGVIYAATIAWLIGCLAFAGPNAISAVFSLAVGPQFIAYSIPIASRFIFTNDFKPGPFHLGAFSLPVAIIAVSWMVFSIVVLLFPATPQASAQDMNYTVVVMGGWFLLSLVWYYFPKYGGVHWFTGPRANIDMYDEKAVTADSSSSKESAHSD